MIICAVQERQYSPLVSEPRPAAAPNRSLDPRGARAVQYCIARARGADEDLDREMELISFLCDHNLLADWRREAAISHLRPFV